MGNGNPVGRFNLLLLLYKDINKLISPQRLHAGSLNSSEDEQGYDIVWTAYINPKNIKCRGELRCKDTLKKKFSRYVKTIVSN